MELNSKLCQVCRKNPVIVPNGVCSTCYNKLKGMIIHDYQWHRSNDCFDVIPENEIEKHILYEMGKEQEDWEHLYNNRVDAIDVYIAVLDNVSAEILTNNPMDICRYWHQRQVSFVRDVLLLVDKSFFHYATPIQVEEFVNAATEFWKHNSSVQKVMDILNSIRLSHSSHSIMDKTFGFEPLEHEEYIFYLMIKEEFDWEWCSWFEVIYKKIYKSLDDSSWIELFSKHFTNEINEWIEDN